MVDNSASLPMQVGEGRYQLAQLLGEGAQGATFVAVDKSLGRKVAVKRFMVRGASSWKEVELAEREARVLQSIDHPLLPKALDHFEENGALYLVMDCMEGEDLSRSEKRFGRREAHAFLCDMASVLKYLKERTPPLIHRDIKPANVILRADGRYGLVDFGSVRNSLKRAGGSTVTGTFGFMAPEQFQGRALPVSDVYGVGVTAVSLLAGEEPEDLPHKGLEIDVAAALGKSAEEPMVRALQQMLRTNPDERAKSIQEALDIWGVDSSRDWGGESEETKTPSAQDGRSSKSQASATAKHAESPSASMPVWVLLPLRLVVWSLQISVMLFAAIALPLLALLSQGLARTLERSLGNFSDAIKQVDRGLADGRLRIQMDGVEGSAGDEPETCGVDARRRIEPLGLGEDLAELMNDAVNELAEIERRVHGKKRKKESKSKSTRDR